MVGGLGKRRDEKAETPMHRQKQRAFAAMKIHARASKPAPTFAQYLHQPHSADNTARGRAVPGKGVK